MNGLHKTHLMAVRSDSEALEEENFQQNMDIVGENGISDLHPEMGSMIHILLDSEAQILKNQ